MFAGDGRPVFGANRALVGSTAAEDLLRNLPGTPPAINASSSTLLLITEFSLRQASECILNPMSEITFEVTDAPEGGYVARAMCGRIYTEAHTLPAYATPGVKP